MGGAQRANKLNSPTRSSLLFRGTFISDPICSPSSIWSGLRALHALAAIIVVITRSHHPPTRDRLARLPHIPYMQTLPANSARHPRSYSETCRSFVTMMPPL